MDGTRAPLFDFYSQPVDGAAGLFHTWLMRTLTDASKLRELLERLGNQSKSAGTVYVVGGGSAVLYGWRPTTVDVDLKLDPEPAGVFGAIRRLKDELQINVELASPDLFIPPLPGWRERSVFIGRFGEVDFYHYDFYSQALAKIERGYERDLADIQAMARAGLIEPPRLLELYDEIEMALDRYPAIDRDAFRAKVTEAVAQLQSGTRNRA